MTVAGQPAVNYTYDVNSRLTRILTDVIASGAWQSHVFDFTYDSLGRRISLTLPNGVKTNYTYDNASHLLTLKHLNLLNIELESLSYTYDSAGNRISFTRGGVETKLPNSASNINYNSANEMVTFNEKNLNYDENGNLLTMTNTCGTTTYTWDARNRLVGINGFKPACSSLTASFKYDALGRRIEKAINGRKIQYLYDGLDIIQEIENNAVTVNYIRTLSIDEPLARIKSDGMVRYYQADALGSVIALTDETGAVKTTYSYDPFGAVTISGETSDNPFQYTGRENDNTGLYYYRARYYSPELQRFISEDPIRLWGGMNFFRYAGNSPINYVDPLGLLTCVLQGCTDNWLGTLKKEYGEWQFMFSRLMGPTPGMVVPMYSLQCWWKRKVIVTYGYEKICTYFCWDDCGRQSVKTTKELKTGTSETTEQTRTGKSFFALDATAYAVPDLYCLQYLRP